MKKATLNGYIQAVSTDVTQHPMQTHLRLVLTPFTPNSNKQGIPVSEAENFINSALNQPLKINMTPYGAAGHDFAFPVGPIVSAEVTELNGEQVIIGSAIVWKNEFPDVDQFLKTASRVDTSWEVFFSDSEIVEETEWLHNVVFAGTCIVSNPAYKGKTPILAISEEHMEELKAQIANLEAELSKLRTDRETDQNAWSAEKSTLEATVTELQGKVKSFEDEKAEAEAKAKLESRRTKLQELELASDDASLATYVNMTDEVFDRVIADLAAVASKNKATSSDKNVRVPNSTSDSQTSNVELKAAFKTYRKK